MGKYTFKSIIRSIQFAQMRFSPRPTDWLKGTRQTRKRTIPVRRVVPHRRWLCVWCADAFYFAAIFWTLFDFTIFRSLSVFANGHFDIIHSSVEFYELFESFASNDGKNMWNFFCFVFANYLFVWFVCERLLLVTLVLLACHAGCELLRIKSADFCS